MTKPLKTWNAGWSLKQEATAKRRSGFDVSRSKSHPLPPCFAVERNSDVDDGSVDCFEALTLGQMIAIADDSHCNALLSVGCEAKSWGIAREFFTATNAG